MDVFPTVRAVFFLKTSFGHDPMWVFLTGAVPPLMLVYTLACHLLFAVTTRSSCFELGFRCAMSAFPALGMPLILDFIVVVARRQRHASGLAHFLFANI